MIPADTVTQRDSKVTSTYHKFTTCSLKHLCRSLAVKFTVFLCFLHITVMVLLFTSILLFTIFTLSRFCIMRHLFYGHLSHLTVSFHVCL